MAHKLPQYTRQKMKGNIGEAFVQYVLSKFALVHKIDGSNDIGNDFICELIRDQSPTNLLFYVQVKYMQRRPQVSQTTLEYWKSSPIPVYLFWLKDHPHALTIHEQGQYFLESIDKKYKRFTPLIHEEKEQNKVEFFTFDEYRFKRDLIVDYARTQYVKGYTPVIKPRDFLNLIEKNNIGFGPYQLYIKDLVPKYSNQIIGLGWANLFSIAVALESTNQQENLKKALRIMEDAESLIEGKHKEDFPHLIEELQKRKQQLERRIS